MPTSELKLTIELVPSTAWYRNVRSNVSVMSWSSLKRIVFLAAKDRCEICSNVGPTHPVECHEVWSYNDFLRVQTLTRLIALCPRCHRVKHLGFALAKNKHDLVEEALQWFCYINDVTPELALEHVRSIFEQHRIRSLHTYQLDVSYLMRLGVDINSHGVERGHTPVRIEY